MVWSWVRRRRWAVAVGAATNLTSAAAYATVVVPYRLVYEAPQECPDERALRDAIAERIGREPFATDDPKTLSVRIERVGRGFRATIIITDREGTSRTRTLESPVDRCSDIFKDVDFVVGTIVEPILIDMPASEEQPNMSDTAPPPRPPPAALPPTPPPPLPTAASPIIDPPARRAEVNGEVYGGLATALFATPGPLSLGGLVGGGVRLGMWRLHGEVRGLAEIPPTTVSLWSGAIVSCVAKTISFCGLFTAGAHSFGEYQGVRPRQGRAIFAAPGLRVGYDLSTRHGLFGRIQLDLVIPLTETSIRARDTIVWISEPVLMSGALVLGKIF